MDSQDKRKRESSEEEEQVKSLTSEKSETVEVKKHKKKVKRSKTVESGEFGEKSTEHLKKTSSTVVSKKNKPKLAPLSSSKDSSVDQGTNVEDAETSTRNLPSRSEQFKKKTPKVDTVLTSSIGSDPKYYRDSSAQTLKTSTYNIYSKHQQQDTVLKTGGPTFFFQKVPKDYLQPFYEKLHVSCKGKCRSEDERYPDDHPDIYYSDEQVDEMAPEAISCLFDTNDEWRFVKKSLKHYNRKIVPTPPDGHCLYKAILDQVRKPQDYDIEMFRRQIALFALSYPHVLHPFVEKIKLDELSYEGWVRGIEEGKVWGDETVIIAVSMMWNVSISLMTTEGIVPIYHNEHTDDIVIVVNGTIKEMTHFTGTIPRGRFPQRCGDGLTKGSFELDIAFGNAERCSTTRAGITEHMFIIHEHRMVSHYLKEMETKLITSLKTLREQLGVHKQITWDVRNMEDHMQRFRIGGPFQCFVDMRPKLEKLVENILKPIETDEILDDDDEEIQRAPKILEDIFLDKTEGETLQRKMQSVPILPGALTKNLRPLPSVDVVADETVQPTHDVPLIEPTPSVPLVEEGSSVPLTEDEGVQPLPQKEADDDDDVIFVSSDVIQPKKILLNVEGTLLSDYIIPETTSYVPSKEEGDGLFKNKFSGKTFLYSRTYRQEQPGEAKERVCQVPIYLGDSLIFVTRSTHDLLIEYEGFLKPLTTSSVDKKQDPSQSSLKDIEGEVTEQSEGVSLDKPEADTLTVTSDDSNGSDTVMMGHLNPEMGDDENLPVQEQEEEEVVESEVLTSPPIIPSTSTAQTPSTPQKTAAEPPKGPPIIPSTSTAQTPSAPQQTAAKKSSKGTGTRSVCEQCGNSYGRRNDLDRHIRKAHKEEKFGCTLCVASYSNYDTLQEHHLIAHMKVLPHTCGCGLKFKWRSTLSKHKKGCSNSEGAHSAPLPLVKYRGEVKSSSDEDSD